MIGSQPSVSGTQFCWQSSQAAPRQWVGGNVISAVHVPAEQTSPVEQALPSLHVVPSGATTSEQMPVAGAQTPARWQVPEAVQTLAVPPVQEPPWQDSPVVHALVSLHDVPLVAAGLEHAPVVESQTPATWHWSAAVQVFGVPPTQAPAWQESTVVHALASLQAVPLVTGGFEQAPVVESQIPAAWHWSEAAQVLGVPPQTPCWQESPLVQALPSLQAVPVSVGLEQAPVAALQTPAAWHWSAAAQMVGVPMVQIPDRQTSLVVQALPSLQGD